jgi:hypothetical protein
MSSLIIKIHHVHECLKIVCDVESEILNSSLLSLFKRKDFAGNHNRLEVVCRKLIELHASLDFHTAASAGVNHVIGDTKAYIKSLLISTEKLIEINGRLSEKSKGQSYSMTEYSTHLNEFRALQNQYCAVGERMNTNYRLYSHEIALMK